MSTSDERLLLERARAGDAEALTRLLEAQEERIYRFGLRMCRDPEDARDVLQETMLAMARGIADFRGASSLSTWLYTIARTQCARRRRRRKLAPAAIDRLEEMAPIADPARNPAEVAEGRELTRALEAAIASLEGTQREVLVLRDVEGLKADEVAEVLGISVQAVKSRLHRARLLVRAQLAPLVEVADAPPAPGTCPDVLQLFSKYLEGDVSAEACREMELHLAGCPRCRGACDSLKHTLALCHAPATAVPAEVQVSVKVALRDFLEQRGG